MPAFEHRRIHRRRLDRIGLDQTPFPRPFDRLVQHAIDQSRLDEVLERAAQSVVVRRPRQPDIRPPAGRILQQRLDAPVTFLLMFPQHQAGKQLRAGEVMTAELRTIIRHAAAGQKMRELQYLARRLAGDHPAWST